MLGIPAAFSNAIIASIFVCVNVCVHSCVPLGCNNAYLSIYLFVEKVESVFFSLKISAQTNGSVYEMRKTHQTMMLIFHLHLEVCECDCVCFFSLRILVSAHTAHSMHAHARIKEKSFYNINIIIDVVIVSYDHDDDVKRERESGIQCALARRRVVYFFRAMHHARSLLSNSRTDTCTQTIWRGSGGGGSTRRPIHHKLTSIHVGRFAINQPLTRVRLEARPGQSASQRRTEKPADRRELCGEWLVVMDTHILTQFF